MPWAEAASGKTEQRGCWHRADGAGVARLLVAAVLVAALSGCGTSLREYLHNGFKVGPNYSRPAAPVADQWLDAQDPQLSAQQNDPLWWRTFQDPVLEDLVHSTYRQNLSLRVAGLRILEARAQRAIVAGELFPQSQQLFGEYARNGISANGPSGMVQNRFFDEWTTGGSLAWELDIWGRFRRAIESADANLDASVENYDSVLVLLLAEVAQSYADVRVAEQRLEYAKQNAEIQRGSLKIAQDRLDAGATSVLDVTQGQSNLAQTEATVPPLEASRRRAVNQLCVLLGMPPQNLDPFLAARRGIPVPPPQVAVGIPAELLRRRPDIRKAEREVAVQSALIGVAESDLYPHFAITGTIAMDATKFSDLFEGRSLAGSVGPSFNWNVLNYGRLRNNVLVQESRFEQLAVQYQDALLRANAEAENAIITFLKAQQQVVYLKQSTKAATESVDTVEKQYTFGKVDFNRVFSIQQFLTQQQDLLAVAEGAVAKSLIELYKSLGGGWQIRLGGPAAMVAQGPAPQPAPTEAPAPPAPLPSPVQ